ncbi:MAG: AAA family ATPase [Ilumatobacteraceae bacterium]
MIGATNREDLIDPAILRPGRLDVKIKIERPSADAAKSIFAQYLTDELPIAIGEDVDDMIEATVTEMYRDDDTNRFLEVTYQNGDKEILYFKDSPPGAMIENIVRRAKKLAIKRDQRRARGICTPGPARLIRQSSASTRTSRTRPTPTTGPRSRARRASGSCSSAPRSRRTRGPEDVAGGRAIERVAHRAVPLSRLVGEHLGPRGPLWGSGVDGRPAVADRLGRSPRQRFPDRGARRPIGARHLRRGWRGGVSRPGDRGVARCPGLRCPLGDRGRGRDRTGRRTARCCARAPSGWCGSGPASTPSSPGCPRAGTARCSTPIRPVSSPGSMPNAALVPRRGPRRHRVDGRSVDDVVEAVLR